MAKEGSFEDIFAGATDLVGDALKPKQLPGDEVTKPNSHPTKATLPMGATVVMFKRTRDSEWERSGLAAARSSGG